MTTDELTSIQKGEQIPCVSVLTSMENIPFQDKKAAMLAVEKAIEKAADILQSMHPEHYSKFLGALHLLLTRFGRQYDPSTEGVGLYVSPVFNKLVQFPLPVQNRIQVADTFLMRELFHLEQYTIDYFVLHLNEKTVQCYKGRLNKLEELRDQNFPCRLHDDHEHGLPTRSASYAEHAGVKSFEKDESILETIGMKSQYQQADHLLAQHLGESPLIIVCDKKDVACMQKVTRHRKNIIAGINGNYGHTANDELGNRTWTVLKNWLDDREHTLMTELVQEKWQQRAVDGVKNVWEAAKAGKGHKLLIEKDYACTAFQEEKSGKLHLKVPGPKHRIITDIIDEILRLVHNKNGEVIFVRNGALTEHQRIALITRY